MQKDGRDISPKNILKWLTHEKMLNVITHQGEANQNHNEKGTPQ